MEKKQTNKQKQNKTKTKTKNLPFKKENLQITMRKTHTSTKCIMIWLNLSSILSVCADWLFKDGVSPSSEMIILDTYSAAIPIYINDF